MSRHGRALASAAALVAAACSSGYFADQAEYCRRAPDDPACFRAGGSAGASGEGGGTGPGGAAGTAGAGGTGGTAGLGGGGAGGGAGGGSGGSGGLACGALKVDCNGACVTVKADDAENCGACGRSCRGSTCEAGACQPEAMTAAGEVAPYALADDGTYLYWVSPAIKAGGSVNDARMRRVAKASAGGAAENVFGSVVVRARSLAFAGGKLYFGDLDAAGVFSGTPGSAFPDASPFAADQLDVRHLTVAAGKAFWSVGGEGAVRGKPLAGGA
ncbi:MAG TPA: hypothetical protein VFS00_18770, partial [Polyangiaceae bacterium]|nr:hypothetical protein [Polyangiaceae bacterium]